MNFNADLHLCSAVRTFPQCALGGPIEKYIIEAASDILAAISKGNTIHFMYDCDNDTSGRYSGKVAFMQYSYKTVKAADKRFVAPGDKLSEYMNNKVFEALYIYLQLKCGKCGYVVNNDYSRKGGTAILCELKHRRGDISVADLLSSPEYYITAKDYAVLNDDILTGYMNNRSGTDTTDFGVQATAMFG